MPQNDPITTVIADDHLVGRKGIMLILEDIDDMRVLAEAKSSKAAFCKSGMWPSDPKRLRSAWLSLGLTIFDPSNPTLTQA